MNYLYTAIFGEYDTLEELPPHLRIPGWRYKCFTDQPIVSQTWEIVKMRSSPKLWRKIKIMPHRIFGLHGVSMWMDANIMPNDSFDLEAFTAGKKYLLMKHPERTNIYAEAQTCIQLGKDDENVIRKQISSYGSGIPGLVATGVMVRKDSYTNRKINEDWWYEVERHSIRDQLSFNYIAYKNNFEYELFNFLEGFRIKPHKNKV